MGVDLYTGSTYTRINTVVTIIGDLKFKSTLEVCMESKLPAKFGELLHPWFMVNYKVKVFLWQPKISLCGNGGRVFFVPHYLDIF